MLKWFHYRNVAVSLRTLYTGCNLCTSRIPSRESVDLYGILNVTPRATQKQIKAAYYRLSLVLHPDKNNDSKDAHDKFTKLNEAYAILADTTSRKNYDRSQRVDHQRTSPFHSEELHIYKTDESSRYDSWTKNHYQAALIKRDERLRKDRLRQEETVEEMTEKRSRLTAVFGVLSAAVLVHFIMKYRHPKK